MHSRLLEASCADCQKVCPVEAIDLTARVPVIDAAACTLCGACAGVCPETVFTMPTPIPPAQGVEHFIACHCHPLITDPDALRCIHSIGLSDLAQMWLGGMRRLVVATDSCAACAAAPMVWIEATVTDFNRLAHCRDLEGIELVSASPLEVAEWQRKQAVPDPSRRAFLRRIVTPKVANPDQNTAESLQQFLALGPEPTPADTLYPFVPQIDPAACLACDDCINICPHQALTLIKANDVKSLYHCVPERCTGCQLCYDICDVDAMEVFSMESRRDDILLARFQCRSCGVQSHTTAADPPKDGQCRICHQTNHHKKLFVVLD